MVFWSVNHWWRWFSMVANHWSNDAMVTIHRSSLVAKLEELPVHKSEMWSWQILVTKIKKSNSAQWLQKGGQTGGWESKGRRGQVKFLKMFPDGRIWRYWMTLPNSVELFTVEFFLAEKLTSKVKIPLFLGFVLPTHFQKQVGWGTWLRKRQPTDTNQQTMTMTSETS